MKLHMLFEGSGVKWKTIEGFPGYEVSNTGKIRNAVTKMELKQQEHYGKDKKEPYFRVKIRNSTQLKNIRVSRAVAFAFLGNPPGPGFEVDHKDGNRANNNVTNLEWVTPIENQHRKHEMLRRTKAEQAKAKKAAARNKNLDPNVNG